MQLEKVTINGDLPVEAARRDAIAKLKSLWGFESELQTNPMPFDLDSLWGATLMPLRACAMDWRRNRILRVGKNSGSTLTHLRAKIHEILRRHRSPYSFQCPCPIVYVVFHSEDIDIRH